MKPDELLQLNSLRDMIYQTQHAALSDATPLMYNLRYSNITQNRALITQLYQEHGLVQVLIDLPVDDAFRGGIDIFCDELDADDIKELVEFIDINSVLKTYAQACKWARLFGGGGLIVNAGQVMDKPFDVDSIKDWTPLKFYAVDRWELYYSPQGIYLDQFVDSLAEVPYNYYGRRLHKTNVIKINGREAPSLIRGQFSGWGVSELEKIVRSLNQYLTNQSVVYELLTEAKIDIFYIQGFNSALATKNGTAKTAERISLASQLKNYNNALAIDKEDGYEQKQITFSGLAEILNEIRKGLACDLRMPLTKLFGISSAGFNAGDDDIENYNAMVETEIRSKVRSGVILMLKICCQKLFGFVPESLSFEFKPLRMLTHKDESELKTQALNRALAAYQNGLITTEKTIEQLNAEKVFAQELDPNEGMSMEELTEIRGSQPGSDVISPESTTTLL